ncbi:MAG TPA: serine/threonine-protein kinase [Chitinivibrionales bacterium]|jgi:serine/threonine protein kinase|nr:serine/threonine-protein kinase [Chitinivibrionales bacterium]
MENGSSDKAAENGGPAPSPPGILSREIPVLPDGSAPLPLGSGAIVSVLGEGGVAIVYEIWVEKLGIARAVKVLKPNASIESTGRFETEMRITAQLRHPNIIEIHNVGEWHGLPYIEMEKIEGFSLDTIIRERGSLPLPVCTSIAIITCRALSYTHNHVYLVNDVEHRGILHRDLKPGNIMISRSGAVKLMDFGLATPTGISMHTMEGTVVGSLQYIAPELLEESRRADARSDIFSLGCVLYEMITGHKTFGEKNMAKLVTARLKNDYKPLGEFKVKCPRSLVKLVGGSLALHPDKRLRSAAEVLRRLEKIHARLTNDKPENLVEYYINSSLRKNTVSFRRPLPRLGVAAAVAAAAVVAGACQFAVPDLPYRIIRFIADARFVSASEAYRRTSGRLAARHLSGKRQDLPPEVPVHPHKVWAGENPASPDEAKSAWQSGAAPGPEDRALVAALQRKYGTKDMLEILGRETDRGKFVSSLRLFDALDRESAATVRARLYMMRALKGLGNKGALAAFFMRPDIPDKEYFVSKAQYLASLKRYIEAIDMCEKGTQSPACIGGADSLDRMSAYLKASCLTSLFVASSTGDARKRALESWNELRVLLHNRQDDPYYGLAEKNIRLLSDRPNGAAP